ILLLLSYPAPPRLTLFPYTTLFRSLIPDLATINQYYSVLIHKTHYHFLFWNSVGIVVPIAAGQIAVASMAAYAFSRIPFKGRNRSEEHTSELQSRENLVCRLLLEKK